LEIDEEYDKKKKGRLHESIQPIEKFDEETPQENPTNRKFG
jgi:hypothetical protein